jgi:hypothetical protein
MKMIVLSHNNITCTDSKDFILHCHLTKNPPDSTEVKGKESCKFKGSRAGGGGGQKEHRKISLKTTLSHFSSRAEFWPELPGQLPQLSMPGKSQLNLNGNQRSCKLLVFCLFQDKF